MIYRYETVVNTLEQLQAPAGRAEPFAARAGKESLAPLSLRTMQINLGKRCNQACRHCHVDASPARTESMSGEIAESCIRVLGENPSFDTVDLTGGAPEMNPHFRFLVDESRKLGKRIVDRCNLTILEEPGFAWLGGFLRDRQVEIIASLPHFSAAATDRQRGAGVFEASIRALRGLNALGYGKEIPLHLVYNPGGFFLAGNQAQLEREFKQKLGENHGIVFSRLYCLNNMPISRFLDSLARRGKLEEYMETLADAFNPATLDGLMCRHQVSIGHDGSLYDCDFNQMLGMPASIGHIRDFDAEGFLKRGIRTARHCYGCTAGAGSSCTGKIA